MMTRSLRLLALICAAAFVSGCSHYRMGTGSHPSFSTLHVEPSASESPLPQSLAPVSTAIREAFIRDGRVALANSPETADATLAVTLTNYRRDVASVRPDDTGLARKFMLTLEAKGTLKDNRTGKILFESRLISASRDIFTDGGQLQAEYQALPLLAQALADQVVHAVLDVW